MDETFWEEESTRIEVTISVEYPTNNFGGTLGFLQTTVIENIPCAFVVFGIAQKPGQQFLVFCNMYKKTRDNASYPATTTITNFKNGEEISSTSYNTNVSFTGRNFSYCDTNIVEDGDGYKAFSAVLENLESKWDSTFADSNKLCFIAGYTFGNSGLTQALNILNSDSNLRDKVSILCNYACSNSKTYIEPNSHDWFNAYGNKYTLVSTTSLVPFGGSAGPINRDMDVLWSMRHYTLMNLLDNFDKWNGGNDDKEKEDRLDIVIQLDGKTDPNMFITWTPTQGYDPNNPEGRDLSNYTVEVTIINGIHGMTATQVTKKSLGTFPLSSDGLTVSFIELIGKYDGLFSDLIGTLPIITFYFTTTFIPNEEWHGEVKEKWKDGDYPTTSNSSPGGVPSLTIKPYSSSNNGGDEGDGGHGGDNTGSGINANSILTKSYVLNKHRTQQLGDFLWGASFMSNIKLLTSSPIENIISVKMYAFELSASEDKTIVIGNVDTQVPGKELSDTYNYRHSCGSVVCAPKYNSFLDYAPYTSVLLYLPYYGFTELDTNIVMGRNIEVSYVIDPATGNANIEIYASGNVVQIFSCQCGVDIPITASNRAQIEASLVSGILRNGFQGAGDVVMGIPQVHYNTTGTLSSSASTYSYTAPYLLIKRPVYNQVAGYGHNNGYLCRQEKQLSSLKGYTEVDPSIDLSNIPATLEELEELRQILSTGFYI